MKSYFWQSQNPFFVKNIATYLYLLQGIFNSGLPEIRKKGTEEYREGLREGHLY